MNKITLFYVLLLLGFGLLFSCSSENELEDNQFFVKKEVSDNQNIFQEISDSLEKNPDNINLWIRKGNICKENLDFKCALNAGAKAFRIDSTNLEARHLYAWTLINKPDAPISD